MNFKIVIPSYNRATILRDKTLSYLTGYGIPLEDITIFVANEEQLEIYRKVIPNGVFIVGCLGMANIRNFIMDYYEEGQRLICMDDDIKALKSLNRFDKLSVIEDPLNLFKDLWTYADSKGVELWGGSPCCNGYYMTDKAIRGLRYTIGNFYGVRVRKALRVSGNDKEDYERTLQYYRANPRGILRFNFITADTHGYTCKGGMNDSVFDRSNDEILRRAKEIEGLYPDLAKLNLGKKSGKPELKLKIITFEAEDKNLIQS